MPLNQIHQLIGNVDVSQLEDGLEGELKSAIVAMPLSQLRTIIGEERIQELLASALNNIDDIYVTLRRSGVDIEELIKTYSDGSEEDKILGVELLKIHRANTGGEEEEQEEEQEEEEEEEEEVDDDE